MKIWTERFCINEHSFDIVKKKEEHTLCILLYDDICSRYAIISSSMQTTFNYEIRVGRIFLYEFHKIYKEELSIKIVE